MSFDHCYPMNMRNLIFALIVAVALVGCAKYTTKKEIFITNDGRTVEIDYPELTDWGKFVNKMEGIEQDPVGKWFLIIGGAYLDGVNLPASGSAPAWTWPVPSK